MIVYRVWFFFRFAIAAGLLLEAWAFAVSHPQGWFLITALSCWAGVEIIRRGLLLLLGWVRVQI